MNVSSTGAVSWLRGAGIAIVAIILSLAVNPTFGLNHPFVIAYPAVFLSAYLGGAIASLVTTFLLAAAATYFWLAPVYAFAVSDEGDAIALFVFMGVGTVVSGLAVARQSALMKTSALRREPTDGLRKPRDTRDTAGEDRLNAVADALRTSEVLIFVHKRAGKLDQAAERNAISPLAGADVRARSSIWIAPSEATACETCGQSMNAGDVAYQIVAAGHDMSIDRTCYQRLIAAVEHGSLRLD